MDFSRSRRLLITIKTRVCTAETKVSTTITLEGEEASGSPKETKRVKEVVDLIIAALL